MNGPNHPPATDRAKGIVVPVRDSAAGRAAVREAAERAARAGVPLHLVVVYDLNDSQQHRAHRTVCPRDTAYLASPRADAEALARECAEALGDLGVPISIHAHRGSLRAAVRRVERLVGDSTPRPLASPVPIKVSVRRTVGERAADARRAGRPVRPRPPAEPAPPDPRRAWKVLALTSVAVLMAFLDVTIVNIAFPAIRTSFPHSSTGDLSWVLNAYNVVFAALLIPAGRLADRVGRRRLFFLGLGTFTGGSLSCGLAPTAELLIAARILQAAGAAALIPSSLGLALPEFPAERRALAVSVWAATGAIAAAAGPSIGGVLVDQAGWRWAFLLNVAIAAAIPFGAHLLVERRAEEHTAPDWAGGAMLAGATGGIALGIVKAETWGWTGTATLACWAVAAALLLTLVTRTRSGRGSIIEPQLFALRSFAVGNASFFLFSIAFYALLLGNILFLTEVWGYSILKAGFAVTPGPLCAVLAAGVAGRLTERQGPRAVAVPACLAFGAACLLYRNAGVAHPDYARAWLPAQVLSGLTIGACFSALAAGAVQDLPPARLATGTAITSCFRQLGAVLGIALLVAVVGDVTPLNALGRFREAWALEAAAAVLAAGVALALPAAATGRRGTAEADASARSRMDELFPRHEDVLHGHVVSYRQAGSGPPLVLVHGLFDSAVTWSRVVEPLSRRFTVIAPDLLGHGQSAAPHRADYSLGAHSGLLRDLLDRLGHDRVTLAGHSMGGGIAMQFAYHYPERVERLVLLSSGGLGREVHPIIRAGALPGASLVLGALASRPGCGLLRAGAGISGPRRGRALREAAVTLGRVRSLESREAALATLRAVIDTGGQRLSALNRLNLLSGIPTLVIWGSRDPIIPVAHGIAGHEALESSRMVILEGVGHHPQLSHPEAVAEIVLTFAAGGGTSPTLRFERRRDLAPGEVSA